MELKVRWRRVWQVRPYETEEVELSVTEQVAVKNVAGAVVWERDALAQLAALGDEVMTERLVNADAHDPRPPSPPRMR